MKRIILLCAALLPFTVQGQAINNQWGYRAIQKTESHVRHFYENDFFTASDAFYTQGINMECVTPGLGKLPTRHLLVRPRRYNVQYGLSLQHNAYTPASIQDPAIRYGDRPYAAALMLQPFAVAINEEKKQRIATMMSIGVTGQIAGGQWMQETIHRYTGNVMPEGWKYQIANDAVVNYKIQFEKQIIGMNNILSVNATGAANAGTLLTKASAGANIMIGYFESPYTPQWQRKFGAYIYIHPQVNAIGYDGSLQGGLFSRSMYTIPTSDIERVVVQNTYGFVLRYSWLYFEYTQTDITREFKLGTPYRWGGVQIGVGF